MRRSAMAAAAVAALLLPAGAVIATSPPDSTPPASPDTASAESTEIAEPTASSEPASTAGGAEATVAEGTAAPTDTAAAPTSEAATIYDDSGNPVAEVTVAGMEPAWGDYEEGDDPEAGREYWRVTVSVASLISDGTFGIEVGDFILQDNNGFVTTAENVATAAQAEADEEITEDADLAVGESVELALTFEVVSSVGPQSIFYSPEDDRLVDVAEPGHWLARLGLSIQTRSLNETSTVGSGCPRDDRYGHGRCTPPLAPSSSNPWTPPTWHAGAGSVRPVRSTSRNTSD